MTYPIPRDTASGLDRFVMGWTETRPAYAATLPARLGSGFGDKAPVSMACETAPVRR